MQKLFTVQTIADKKFNVRKYNLEIVTATVTFIGFLSTDSFKKANLVC